MLFWSDEYHSMGLDQFGPFDALDALMLSMLVAFGATGHWCLMRLGALCFLLIQCLVLEASCYHVLGA